MVTIVRPARDAWMLRLEAVAPAIERPFLLQLASILAIPDLPIDHVLIVADAFLEAANHLADIGLISGAAETYAVYALVLTEADRRAAAWTVSPIQV